MMNRMLNVMRAQADMAGSGRAAVRLATVTSYDPGNYCVKVEIQPEGTETGWIPLVSPWVGNGWGLFAPPSIGDLIEVQFQEDDFEAGFACQRFYNDEDRPLSVPSGEFWLVHQSGSFLKFFNDGNVALHSQADLNATVGGNLSATVGGTADITSGGDMDLTAPTIGLNGEIILNGPVTQGKGSNGGNCTMQGPLNVTEDVTAGGISLMGHHHTGVIPGGGNTGGPA